MISGTQPLPAQSRTGTRMMEATQKSQRAFMPCTMRKYSGSDQTRSSGSVQLCVIRARNSSNSSC